MRLLFTLIGQQARRHPLQYAIFAAVAAVTTAFWVIEPLYASYAIDALLGLRDGVEVDVTRIFVVWGVIFLCLSVVQTAEKYMTWRIMNSTELGRSEELYRHVLDLDVAFHTRQKTGEVVKILDEGAENLAELQRNLLADFLPSLAAAGVFLVIGMRIHPLLALILLGAIALYLGIVVIGSTRTMQLQKRANRAWVSRIGRAYDAIMNVLSVKSGAQEGRELQHLSTTNNEVFRLQMGVNKRWAAVEAINFFMLTRILLIAVGILLYIRGIITLGELYFFQSSFYRVLTPFEVLSGLVPFWNKKVGKVRLSQELLETPVRVRNPVKPTSLPDLKGGMRFEKVCFRYDEMPRAFDADDEAPPAPAMAAVPEALPEDLESHAREPMHPTARKPRGDAADLHSADAIHDLTLDIKAGEHIALVGHSGAGKSTIAMLLNRFYDPTEGAILIDGVDMRALDMHWWRAQIGLVLQDNITFNDSIRRNIAYARPQASMEEVTEAARRAAAHDFISRLPHGYDTLVGDRGVRLSGGERQRVAIARAILKRPKLVVLDEATSALDSITEAAVQQGIRELIAGRTAVIIAHRLSTVRSVDRIAVLDAGRLIAVGPHEELFKTCPVYREMVELQSHGMLAE